LLRLFHPEGPLGEDGPVESLEKELMFMTRSSDYFLLLPCFDVGLFFRDAAFLTARFFLASGLGGSEVFGQAASDSIVTIVGGGGTDAVGGAKKRVKMSTDASLDS